MKGPLHGLAKALQGLGLVLVLVGLMLSIRLGWGEDGLESMRMEMLGLIGGGLVFALGWLLEARIGGR
jgi:hypothetical protein